MSFRQIQLEFPNCPGCEVVGFLYDSSDISELGEDMIEVRIRGEITINAGWYPEGEPSGKYRIKTWGKIELPDSFARSADEAAEIIRELVEMFTSEGPQPISDSYTTVYRETNYELV